MNTLKCIINNALFLAGIPELTGDGLRRLNTHGIYHVKVSVDLLKM